MNASLQLNATVGFAMTPQLQESIRLLQLSSTEFEQEVEEGLVANPFLERASNAAAPTAGSGPIADAVRSDNQDPAAPELGADGTGIEGREYWRAYPSSRDADDDTDFTSYTPMPTTLRDHLQAQLAGAQLTERDRALVEMVIEALDERGYLRESIDELVAMCSTHIAVEAEELRAALRFVQSMDPVGVGARSLQECLELQIRARGSEGPAERLALTIVRDHLELLAAHDFLRLGRELDCSEEALRDANAVIRSCNPRPAEHFGADETRYVLPDVLVRKANERWVVAINPAVIPDVRINHAYATIVRSRREECSSQFAQQLQHAKWMIRNIRQRFTTIRRVAQAIVERQRRFLDYGPVAMRPLMMRDIAAGLGLHESTVSRVANGKYMSTPRGLFEFRYFFGSQIAAADGVACSSTAIRALIKQIIEAEPQRRPLSDIKVARILAERGIRVARRTVSKYRDAMRIPPVEARRMAAA